jgi:BlaI family transcriptional regulator, penicillinase repressor
MTKKQSIIAAVCDAEAEVLKQLWDESPLSAQEIIDRLQGNSPAHPKTVKTLINRLLKKGALGFHEQQRTYYYYPTIKKVDFYHSKTESFLDKFFDGELSPMVSFFSSRKKLNGKEIAELKKLIADLEGNADDE